MGWVSSYLSGRSQCVKIEGCLSKLLPVNVGVPQGSILGPLLYTLFTNELPEVIHDQLDQQGVPTPELAPEGSSWPAYHISDEEHGSICCYADDTTFTTSDTDPATLTTKLTAKYKVIAQFMVTNRLKLNDDKTHLLVMTTGLDRRRAMAKTQVKIMTPSEIISPSKSEKLLGCVVHDDLKWVEHLRDNKENLIGSLNTRLGALKKIQRIASFKNRKMISEGLFMSKLSYLIAVWGGCGAVLKKSLQIIQNKVARVVTRLDWLTPASELLQQCGWLSVNQLVFYHSVLLVYKVRLNKTPRYLDTMHNSWSYQYRTRQAESGLVKMVGRPRLEITRNSFRWRAANQYNQLSADIRNSETLVIFKLRVKTWIKINVPFN